MFNYELDERQIRLTLHDAELDSLAVSWAEFDSAYPGHLSKASGLSAASLPKISLNINRNVLVPLFFIIALGSVSAVLFRFINFKTNKPVEVEKALMPDASGYELKAEKKETPPPAPEKKATLPPVKTEASKETTPLAVTTATLSSTPVSQPPLQNAARMPMNKPAYPVATVQKPAPDSTANAVVSKSARSDSSATASNTSRSDTNNAYNGKGRRKKKVTADQVESLKAPTTLISTQTAETDPEPELRLQ